MDAEIHQSFAQLFGVGLIWVSVHCVGMCGPILIGLDVGGVRTKKSLLQGVLRILAYQSGRAMVYATLGAVFGAVGAGIASSFEKAGAVFALLFALALIIYTLSQMSFWRKNKESSCQKSCSTDANDLSNLVVLNTAVKEKIKEKTVWGVWAYFTKVKNKVMLLLAMANRDAGYLGALLTGISLAFMPCMITFWVLGLAAVTASPIYGALLMLSLVMMTTPMLVGVTLLPRTLSRFRSLNWGKIAPYLKLLSALWLILMALASLEMIEHLHFGFQVGARHYLLMLY